MTKRPIKYFVLLCVGVVVAIGVWSTKTVWQSHVIYRQIEWGPERRTAGGGYEKSGKEHRYVIPLRYAEFIPKGKIEDTIPNLWSSKVSWDECFRSNLEFIDTTLSLYVAYKDWYWQPNGYEYSEYRPYIDSDHPFSIINGDTAWNYENIMTMGLWQSQPGSTLVFRRLCAKLTDSMIAIPYDLVIDTTRICTNQW